MQAAHTLHHIEDALQEAPLPRLELAASDTENEHSDDSAGEKEAKRQRSEPTTPVSTSSRQPWKYDAIMGITRVGTKEAERFEEDLDSTEYHDATEEPTRKEETARESQQLPKPVGISGGIGSSSLKECIELLNATVRNSPAPLDSGISLETTDPPQFFRGFSPKMCIKKAPSASFPSILASVKGTSASFPSTWGHNSPGFMLVHSQACILVNLAPKR